MRTVLMFSNALILTLLCVGAAFAAFDDMGIGARPLGMGGAFVAVADDANAAMHNSAGLGYITVAKAGFTHVRMFSGVVNYNYAGIVLPLGAAGSFGVSYGRLGEESGIYSENSVALSLISPKASTVFKMPHFQFAMQPEPPLPPPVP